MHLKEESPIYSYSGHGISFSTTDKKFAALAYRHIKKLAEKELAKSTSKEIKDLDSKISSLA